MISFYTSVFNLREFINHHILKKLYYKRVYYEKSKKNHLSYIYMEYSYGY